MCEALDFAVQVASAPTAAHAIGIVNRDIKHDNVVHEVHDPILENLSLGVELSLLIAVETKGPGRVSPSRAL